MNSDTKLKSLEKYLKSLGSVAVAFSGGVDSTFLISVAHNVLGNKALAITAGSPVFPSWERDESASFCSENGIRYISFDADILSDPDFCANPPDRCYICKKKLFKKIIDIARDNGVEYVCEGSNLSDRGDYRPGMKAVAELGIKSPLLECGLSKDEIRQLSREMGLSTWSKPSFACLASRFVYGEKITQKKLAMVEQGENLLHRMGFTQYRVRLHGDNLARLEVMPDELPKLLAKRIEIEESLKRLGFAYVTADLEGYRTGSMNEVLDGRKKI